MSNYSLGVPIQNHDSVHDRASGLPSLAESPSYMYIYIYHISCLSLGVPCFFVRFRIGCYNEAEHRRRYKKRYVLLSRFPLQADFLLSQPTILYSRALLRDEQIIGFEAATLTRITHAHRESKSEKSSPR